MKLHAPVDTHTDEMIFISYLKAGIIWPQIRGGINIYLLNAITKAYAFDWEAFRILRLSEKYLNMAGSVFNVAYHKSGILRPYEIDFEGDWRSAKAAVFKSILHFISGSKPQYRLSIKQLLTEENAELIQKFIEKEPDKWNTFCEMTNIAKAEIDKYSDIAQLYVSCISTKTNYSSIHLRTICIKYHLQFTKISLLTTAQECLYVIDCKLRKKLRLDFPSQSINSICWGFQLS
jgi:hypothetical protein